MSRRFAPTFQGNRRAVRPLPRIALAIACLAASATGEALAVSGAPQANGPAPGCEFVTAGEPPAAVERDTDPVDVPLDGRTIVSPLLVAVDADEALTGGEQFVCTVTIRNRHPVRMTYELQRSGLLGSRAGSSGVRFVDADDPDAAAPAARWLEPAVETVTIPPRGVARVPVRVTVPEDPPPGSAHASLDIVPPASDVGPGETNLGIETRIAVPFLLATDGEARPELRLRDVRAQRLRWSRDPWTLRANVDNEGNVHATPSGRVRIRSLFGNTVAELPITPRPLLPEGRRRIEVTWEGVPWFGLYRHDVRISADDGDAVARASGWFVALPPWWVLVIAALVLLAALAARIGMRRSRDQWLDIDADDDDFER